MQTLTDNIASWEESFLSQEQQFAGQGSIATESEPSESPAWEVCIDALLQLLTQSPTPGLEPPPNGDAIKAALSWVAFLKRRFPGDPPTCIIREPSGGVIVERRAQLLNGSDCLCELTFYNDGSAERTDYFNGKIRQMVSIPPRPRGA
jgi:hypothetical protein